MNELEAQVQRLRDKADLLRDQCAAAQSKAARLVEAAKAKGLNPITGDTPADRAEFDQIDAAYKEADGFGAQRDEVLDELHRLLDSAPSSSPAVSDGRAWATEVAARIRDTSDVTRAAIMTDPIEVPSIVEPGVIALPHDPARLVDVLVERRPLTSNVYEYIRQTVRDNQAEPVPDLGEKPTSIFTVEPVEDRARVVAHLSEPIPERFLMDQADLVRWLESEMREGVLDALETQIVAADGSGEQYTGILETVGVTEVEFTGDELATLRKARTVLELLKEKPTAWVLNPNDAETVDLAREDEEGAYLVGGGLTNIFGDIPRVSATSIPEGVALLADWRQTRLYVREAINLRGDRSGPNFTTNAITLRAEGRFGFAVLRPQAIAVIDLTGSLFAS